jgi:UDP:flavonoid glycosyltransferase YjiC (YdhE family)
LMIANRVEELGAGLVIARPRMNAQTIRDTAARLLSEPGFKAGSARVGESLRTAGGVKRAVDEIEAMVKGKQLA